MSSRPTRAGRDHREDGGRGRAGRRRRGTRVGYRYGQRAYLVQLRRAGAGTAIIDPIACRTFRHRRGAAGRRGRAARRLAGSALPGRDRLPAAAAVRHRACRAAARLSAGGARHAGRRGARPAAGEGALRRRLVGPRRCARDARYAALDVEVLVELRDALADELAARARANGRRRSSRRCSRPSLSRRGPTRGGAPRAFTGCSPAGGSPWSASCGPPGTG